MEAQTGNFKLLIAFCWHLLVKWPKGNVLSKGTYSRPHYSWWRSFYCSLRGTVICYHLLDVDQVFLALCSRCSSQLVSLTAPCDSTLSHCDKAMGVGGGGGGQASGLPGLRRMEMCFYVIVHFLLHGAENNWEVKQECHIFSWFMELIVQREHTRGILPGSVINGW